MIRVNGEYLPLAGSTLSAYLAETKYDPARIAIERNGEIVSKRTYDETVGTKMQSMCIRTFRKVHMINRKGGFFYG